MEGHFNQIVRDAVSNLKNKGTGYCFSLEQLSEIQRHFKTQIKHTLIDGVFQKEHIQRTNKLCTGTKPDAFFFAAAASSVFR